MLLRDDDDDDDDDYYDYDYYYYYYYYYCHHYCYPARALRLSEDSHRSEAEVRSESSYIRSIQSQVRS